MWHLKHFDVDDFLANYWQKKPLLIRQGFPGFETVLSPEELAGLACEAGVHSRLVIEKDGDTPWQLRYGPFQEEDFTSLPMTHYSLLVSECEKWIPELQELVECFDFIPKWRVDDLMISYAPEHGSVGPHIDEYDVFLIQANGKRRWSIEQQIRDKPALIADLDLAIMQEFQADEEWVLEPGDILYLPPKIAHHGVAIGHGCMTYSVGFRAPSVGDIMDSCLLEASDHGLTDQRYYDAPLGEPRNPAEIRDSDIAQFKSMLNQMLENPQLSWPDIIGRMVSDSALSDDVETRRCDSIQQACENIWQKHPDSRMCYYQDKSTIRLYANGQLYRLQYSQDHLILCQLLCNQQLILLPEMTDMLDSQGSSVVLALINADALIPVLEDDVD